MLKFITDSISRCTDNVTMHEDTMSPVEIIRYRPTINQKPARVATKSMANQDSRPDGLIGRLPGIAVTCLIYNSNPSYDDVSL